MNIEEIEEQLKLSKRQNKDERYDYLCSEFNAINYCVKLEKYTNKLQQENKQLKDNWNLLKGYLEHSIDWEKQLNEQEDNYMEIYREVLDKIKELEEGE